VIAGVVTLLAVVAYVLARTIGLPQIGDDIGNWSDPLGTAAIASESLTFVVAGVVLVSRRRTGGVPVITGGVPVIEPVEIPDRWLAHVATGVSTSSTTGGQVTGTGLDGLDHRGQSTTGQR
jgi:hypothetical protein